MFHHYPPKSCVALSVLLVVSFSSSLSVIGADAGNGIRVFIPDIGMFVAGLVIWLLCRSLVQKRPPEDMAQYNADFVAEEQVSSFFVKHKNPPAQFLESAFTSKIATEMCKNIIWFLIFLIFSIYLIVPPSVDDFVHTAGLMRT